MPVTRIAREPWISEEMLKQMENVSLKYAQQ